MDRIIKTDKGIGPINPDALQDRPHYLRQSSYPPHNAIIGVDLKGVRNSDKIEINKSDYSPSVGRDKT